MSTPDAILLESDASTADANVGRAQTILGLIASIRTLAAFVAGSAETTAIRDHANDLASELASIEHDLVQPLLHLAEEAASSAHGRVEAAHHNPELGGRHALRH